MKKILAVLLCGIIGLSVVGCGSKIPEGMSEETYNTGNKILDCLNEYIDADIDDNELYSKIDNLQNRIDSSEGTSSLNLSINVSSVLVELNNRHTGRVSLSAIKKSRDAITNALEGK